VHGPILAFVDWRGSDQRERAWDARPSVFTLTRAFGNQPNDGTRLADVRAGPHDWWDEHPASAHHDRHVRSATSPDGDAENLYDAGYAYSLAVVINYHYHPVVRGAGSSIFLHVSGGGPPTAAWQSVPVR
jgi:L,D-peptidoglycan transpeptidase YkuD (ErfK/YbiS/YcfS/YnhG family)